MEVENGYKQTELGVIPNDWEVLSVEDLISRGYIEKPLDGNHGDNHPKYGDFVDRGIPFIMANNVCNNLVDVENCHFITKEQGDRLQKGFSVTGDVLFTHKGTVGNVAIVGAINTDYIMLTPQVTYYRVINPKAINNLYIKQYFLSNYFQGVIKTVSGGGTRAYIGITAQRRLPFIMPATLQEQTAIATALSDADALISSLEKLIAKKRYIKQGAMQELLKPKKGWEVKRLGEILRDFQLGGNYQNSESVNNYPLMKMGNIQRGEISLEKIEYIKDGVISERDKLQYGDLLLNTRNTLDLVGKVAVWRNELPVAYFNSNLMRMKFKSSYVASNFFMNYMFNTKSIITKLKEIATGTTSVAAIYSRDLFQLGVPLPSLDRQLEITAILCDMDNEIIALQTILSKYRQIKTGMMQNLLTGKIRLV